MKTVIWWIGVVAGLGIVIEPAIAQVIPDGTLSTTVTQSGNNFTITNGNQVGSNLFHSFSQFSVPTGSSAYFNNALDVQTIFARVTGGSASNIDGLIRANGSANLFLLNPAGILFGPNARLNLGGSFVASTANSITFADGIEFSATNPPTFPLLTMSVPIGLQMGQTSSTIQVQGQSHNLLHPATFLNPVIRDPLLSGLQVQPGKTLALLGNGIQLDGGVVIAESGRIELGSVSAGTVHLNTTMPTWNLSYNSVPTLSDITLTRAALLDASGNPGGSIQVQGKDVWLQDSSIIFVQHQGNQAAGRIQVNADRLEMSGALPNKDQSLILSENIGSGHGADIAISARQIVARDGGEIFSATYQNGGTGGNISVNATESIQLFGASPFDATRFSGIGAPSYIGGGVGGSISVTTQDFIARNGAGIISRVLGGAGSGNIHINANLISLIGENPPISGNTSIISSTFFGGDAGSIFINTGRLVLGASGAVSAGTSGSGNAGNLTIHARESIEIDGSGQIFALPSRIAASGQLLPLRFRQIFGLPASPTGNGGNLTITAPVIRVKNQGFIAAENVGRGNAGRLQIQADSILLDNQGQIRTSANIGNAGNLELTVRDLVLLRRNSLISARAGELGNGGNITINAPIILGLENSDIIANAVRGRGGNIEIMTQGIFGLKFRPQLTPENDITASSQFGLSGTVQVNTIGIDPNAGLVKLPADVADPSQQIATGCVGSEGSSFVATGRGGVPQNPTNQMTGDRPWNDMRDLSAYRQPGHAVTQMPAPPPALVQASTWHRHADGTVELIADQFSPGMSTFLVCGGNLETKP
jgi:filamentous hemagglutinin family protein